MSYPYVQNIDKGNFKEVKTRNTYTFLTSEKKERFKVESIENDTIKGSNRNETFAIAKKDIVEIRKNNNGATFGLIGGVLIAGTVSMVVVAKAIGEGVAEAILTK